MPEAGETVCLCVDWARELSDTYEREVRDDKGSLHGSTMTKVTSIRWSVDDG